MMNQPNYQADASNEEASEFPEFTPPEGLNLNGDEGEATVKWQRKEDGQICITEFDGVALAAGDQEQTQAETDPDEGKMGAGAMDSYMNAEGA